MRAQILLREGPYDMHLVSYATHEQEFPLELRVADAECKDDVPDVWAAVYRRVEVEDAPVSLMKLGLYEFSGMKDSKASLVQVWVD